MWRGRVRYFSTSTLSSPKELIASRLQVEHPVTEAITGLDLVEWQLRVAAGQPLPKQQAELSINGHAIEARVYAENPEKGFLPSIGTLRHMDVPSHVAFELGGSVANGVGHPAGVRIDSGVREGDAISPFYDPMIAKLIVWGADRAQALARMAQALSEFHIVGLATNIAFLKRLVEGDAFAHADLDTGLIERNNATLFPPAAPAPAGVLALAALALLDSEQTFAANARNPADPWAHAHGWRMNGTYRRQLAFADEYAATLDARAYRVGLTYQPHGWVLDLDGKAHPLALVSRQDGRYAIRFDGSALQGTVRREGEVLHVFSGGQHHALTWNDPMAHAGDTEAAGGRLTAPMPGKVVAVIAAKGQTVKKGEPLVIMEAMKMEHTIAAPSDGLVEEILYQVGDQVSDGAPLLAFTAS